MIVINKDDLVKLCEVVASLQDGLAVASQLHMELDKHPGGVGLAAPQIGIAKQVFIIRCKDFISSFINPTILSKKEPFVHEKEGCLSFPGQIVDTIRYKTIKVKDLMTEQELSNEASVIFQHEYEHISGKTMFDSIIPDAYNRCFCGSEQKYKFCCMKKINGRKKKIISQ